MPCQETIIGHPLGKLESLRGLQNVRAAGSISHEERRRRLTCLTGRQLTNIVRDEQQLAEVQAEPLATEDLVTDHAEQAEAAEMRTERNERQQVWNRDRTELLRKIAMNFAPNTDQNLLFLWPLSQRSNCGRSAGGGHMLPRMEHMQYSSAARTSRDWSGMVRQTPVSFLTEETQWHLSSSIPWQKTDVVGRVLKQLWFGFKENRTKTGHPFCSSKRSSGRSNHLFYDHPALGPHPYFSQ